MGAGTRARSLIRLKGAGAEPGGKARIPLPSRELPGDLSFRSVVSGL